jgi:DNA-binding transcriptional LysR family regulator
MTARRNQLQYLVTVAEEGQITSAARKLNLAQPALSQAIAQLESELGIELLDRHPRGVTLTAAGETFLVKARAALAAETDAAQTGQALARAARGAIAIGFIGPPPALGTPELFTQFVRSHSEAQVVYQDLCFPRGATSSWLGDVDVALCHAPLPEPGVRQLSVRVERRAMVLAGDHPLAERDEIELADVLDETFVSYHPDVQPAWAGFHSLDDHRGGPPARMTHDHALTSLQMLGIMTSARAVTVVPEADARIVARVASNLTSIPLRDAAPARVSLVWREESNNPLVDALVSVAESSPGSGHGV